MPADIVTRIRVLYGRGMSGDLTRLTVNLTPKAVAAMEEASARDGGSKTDIVNRALQLYNMISRLSGEHERGFVTMLDEDGERIRLYVL